MYNEVNQDDYSQFVNVGDKMDWKLVIQRALERAHNCYKSSMKRDLIISANDIIANNYPGMKCREDINNYKIELKREIDEKHDDWLLRNPLAHRAQRYIAEEQFIDYYYKKLLLFLTNYASEKRMMLFGSPQSRGLSYDEL